MESIVIFGWCIFYSTFSFAQITIEGKVTHATEDWNIRGVNVVIKNTYEGDVTDTSGVFLVQVESLPATLLFSYVGLEEQEIVVDSIYFLNVEMKNQTIFESSGGVMPYYPPKRKNWFRRFLNWLKCKK